MDQYAVEVMDIMKMIEPSVFNLRNSRTLVDDDRYFDRTYNTLNIIFFL